MFRLRRWALLNTLRLSSQCSLESTNLFAEEKTVEVYCIYHEHEKQYWSFLPETLNIYP